MGNVIDFILFNFLFSYESSAFKTKQNKSKQSQVSLKDKKGKETANNEKQKWKRLP